MPSLHHPVIDPLGRDGAAIKLARQPDSKIANVDHLLDFAFSLGNNLAGLEGDEATEIGLRGP